MGRAFVPGNYAQTTVAATISNVATSFTPASTAGFVVPGTNEVGIIRVDDTGNAAWNIQSGPFEIMYFGTNSGGVLGSLVRGQDSTTAKSFAAGATVTQGIGSGFLSLLPQQIATASPSAVASVALASLPTALVSGLMILWQIQSSTTQAALSLRINNDSAAHYNSSFFNITSSTFGSNSSSITSLGTSAQIGEIGSGGWSGGRIFLPFTGAGFSQTMGEFTSWRGDTVPGLLGGAFQWTGAANVTEIDFLASSGTLTGRITIYGIP